MHTRDASIHPGYTRPTLSLAQPDLGILRRAQRGDERAFSIIVRAYETPVFNYVLRLVGDRSLAEDLTQEVFLRVFQGLPKFSLRCRFTTWLFQVTKNRVLDELRANERRPRATRPLDDVPHTRGARRAARAGRGDRRGVARGRELNVDLKMALLLRDVVGLSYTEIADSLEVTLATVKWRIYKAREEVQLALAREGITYGRSAPADRRRRTPRRQLDTLGEPLRERRGQPGLAGFPFASPRPGIPTRRKNARPGPEVEQEPGGARIAVARLADGARG